MFNSALTLWWKEILRFWKVSLQTLMAPILTSLLYLLIFSHVMQGHMPGQPSLRYVEFLLPGLIMMSMIQNAFANTSSSLIQSKITGNIVFILLAPIPAWHMACAYIGAALVRGLAVGLGMLLFTHWFYPLPLAHPWLVLYFTLAACFMAGGLGLLAGIWAEKFDQLAGFQNFLIMPLTFLAGVFYSIHSLPPFWLAASHANPFFYMVDGFRYGILGVADAALPLSMAIAGGTAVLLFGLSVLLLKSGYKLRR